MVGDVLYNAGMICLTFLLNRRLLGGMCLCLCVVLGGRLPTAQAQNESEPISSHLRFTRLMIEDGLPNNLITDILQDRQGFMWIGTEDGLVRYDGYDMRVFQVGAPNRMGLNHSSITGLAEGGDGRIWIGTNGGGINIFDPHTERFSYLLHEPHNENSLASNAVFKPFVDSRGDVWFGSIGLSPLTRYDPVAGTI